MSPAYFFTPSLSSTSSPFPHPNYHQPTLLQPPNASLPKLPISTSPYPHLFHHPNTIAIPSSPIAPTPLQLLPDVHTYILALTHIATHNLHSYVQNYMRTCIPSSMRNSHGICCYLAFSDNWNEFCDRSWSRGRLGIDEQLRLANNLSELYYLLLLEL